MQTNQEGYQCEQLLYMLSSCLGLISIFGSMAILRVYRDISFLDLQAVIFKVMPKQLKVEDRTNEVSHIECFCRMLIIHYNANVINYLAISCDHIGNSTLFIF